MVTLQIRPSYLFSLNEFILSATFMLTEGDMPGHIIINQNATIMSTGHATCKLKVKSGIYSQGVHVSGALSSPFCIVMFEKINVEFPPPQ